MTNINNKQKNTKKTPYNKLREFHTAFGHPINDVPTAMSKEDAYTRFSFMLEEIIEFLYASTKGNKDEFLDLIADASADVTNIAYETITKGESNPEEFTTDLDVIIGQVDALIDNLYFTYGSLTMLAVDPEPVFDIVHTANMNKLDKETGKPIIRESDGKFMKPENWERDFAPEKRIKEEILNQLGSAIVNTINNDSNQ